jgi:hypothetical protein
MTEHGTPAGFAEGCRVARGCVNWGSVELMTCEEANTRAKWDRAYVRRLAAGDLSALREAFEAEGFRKYRHTARAVWAEDEYALEPVRETPFELDAVRVRTDPEARREAVRERLEEVAGVPVTVIEEPRRAAAVPDAGGEAGEAWASS